MRLFRQQPCVTACSWRHGDTATMTMVVQRQRRRNEEDGVTMLAGSLLRADGFFVTCARDADGFLVTCVR